MDNNTYQVIAALTCAIGLVLNDKPQAMIKKKLNEALTGTGPLSSLIESKIKKMADNTEDIDELSAIAYLGETINRWASGSSSSQVATSIVDAATLLGYKNMD